MEVAIEAKNPADLNNLLDALRTLTLEDDLFRMAFDEESGQVILKGMNERHLDAKIDALHHSGGFEVYVGAPQVAYLETMTLRAEQDITFDGQVGGRIQFARVRMVFKPKKTDADRDCVSKIDDGTLPEQYLAGIESGIQSVIRAGVLAGFPVVGVAVTLIEGAFRDGPSSSLAFEIAARTACRQALQQGRSIVLEPIMRIEVVTPREFSGAAIGDLRSRRGRIEGERKGGNTASITAIVPLSNMFGYQNQLASFSRGRGTFTMAFACYAPTPPPFDDRPPPAAAAALRA